MANLEPMNSRAEHRRAIAGRNASRKLAAAAKALAAYLSACRHCADGSGDEKTGIADGRIKLISDASEYAGYLDSKYGGGS